MFPTPYLAELYRIYVSLLWGFTNHNDSLGSFEQMSEPLIGNPIRVKRKNTYISQDLCHSYRDYHTIVTRGYDDRSSNGRVIGELGSGYGRVGYVFGMLSDARYCFFDIPPALAIAQTYFEAVFPDRKIFGFRDFSDFAVVEAEIGASQFAFFTANQIALFPDSYFDTFINISSLHEMRHDQISHYLKEFDRLTRRSIYLKQWTSWENTRDNIVVTSNDYPLPEHWEPVIDQQDAALPLFFERLLRRR
jgi:putative sugar O-methyltransferase